MSYIVTDKGRRKWQEWDISSIIEDAQQQIIVICGSREDGATISDLVYGFASPIKSTSEAALWTKKVFEYAMHHLVDLVDDLVEREHLRIVNL